MHTLGRRKLWWAGGTRPRRVMARRTWVLGSRRPRGRCRVPEFRRRAAPSMSRRLQRQRGVPLPSAVVSNVDDIGTGATRNAGLWSEVGAQDGDSRIPNKCVFDGTCHPTSSRLTPRTGAAQQRCWPAFAAAFFSSRPAPRRARRSSPSGRASPGSRPTRRTCRRSVGG